MVSEIASVVALLEQRGVSLWHACQLQDLRSYVEVGGIPSRSLLEQARLSFTGFVTDATDRSAGVWPKVFVNLSDFGAAFAHGAEAVPNPYGPIVMQIRPSALLAASDVAICLRSAGARDFDREVESLKTVGDIDLMFRHSASSPFPLASFLLYGEQLKERFAPRHPYATTAELSVSIDPELIPFDDVIALFGDPIDVGGEPLIELVQLTVRDVVPPSRVRTRWMSDQRLEVIADVARYVGEGLGPPSLRLLAGRSDLGTPTKDWATSVLSRDLDWLFKRYADYLRLGTLNAPLQPAPRQGRDRVPEGARSRSGVG